MNKNIVKGICVLCTTLMLASCGNNTNERTGNNPSVIESKPAESHYVISEKTPDKPNRTSTNEDGTLTYKTLTVERVQLTQKARIDKAAADKMEEVLAQATDRHLAVFDAQHEYLFTDLESGKLTEADLPIETKVNYTVVRNDGRAISIIEEITVYNGGKLASTTKFGYNFVPSTGVHLYTDVFYDADDKKSIDDADTRMMKKLNDKYGDIVSYDTVETSLVEEAQDSWYFTENGIKVMFNPGDVADESHGALEIEYTKDELISSAKKYFN